MKLLITALSLFGFLLTSSQAEDLPPIEIGKKAPDFTLKDTSGEEQKLSDYLKNGPVALVFFRSGDW